MIKADRRTNLYYIVFGGEINEIHSLLLDANMQHEFIFIQVRFRKCFFFK